MWAWHRTLVTGAARGKGPRAVDWAAVGRRSCTLIGVETLVSTQVYANPWMVVREDVIRRPDGSTGVYGVIDTADIAEIREALSLGLLDGVTTNPSLIAATGKPMRDVLAAICDVVDGPVSGEVLTTNFDEMMEEARDLAAIAGVHPAVGLVSEVTIATIHNGQHRGAAPTGKVDGSVALAKRSMTA